MKILLFLFLITLVFGCTTSTKNPVSGKQSTDSYSEQYRPQVHFSPERNWMNDPNGLVYYKGEYHLFFQHNPDTTIWGPMHWGHAISNDLLHWEQLPIALYPDSLGYIFSGSAVIDWNNTSGFGDFDNPAMIAIYTYHDMDGEKSGRNNYQTQAIAYSIDKGRTWTKYENNPVLPNPGIKDFRDPKVSWNDALQKWTMIFAAHDHVQIYSSQNLKEWVLESNFGLEYGAHSGVWECPDLFPLKIDGSDEVKWILSVSLSKGGPNGGSATQYFIGDFNGKEFIPIDNKTRWLDYGNDNYAGVTWSDIPEEDGRRLFIGWMTCIGYHNETPTSTWRGNLTIPRELTLKKDDLGYLISTKPIREIESLVLSSEPIEKTKISDKKVIAKLNAPVILDLKLNIDVEYNGVCGVEFSNKLGEKFRISYDKKNSKLFMDRTKARLSNFHDAFPGIQYAPCNLSGTLLDVKLVIDHASVELFALDGSLVMTDLFFPTEDFSTISLFSENGEIELIKGNIKQLSSIYKN